MYASISQMRAMQFKEEITLIKRKNRLILEYLHAVKALADKITLIDHPISDDDLTLYILNGLIFDFRDITASIRKRGKSLSFEELYDLLVGHDSYLRRLQTTTQQLMVMANYTNCRTSFKSSYQKDNGKPFWSLHNQGQDRDLRSQYQTLGQPNNNKKWHQPKCQFCDQIGHTTKLCPQLKSHAVTTNYTPTSC